MRKRNKKPILKGTGYQITKSRSEMICSFFIHQRKKIVYRSDFFTGITGIKHRNKVKLLIKTMRYEKKLSRYLKFYPDFDLFYPACFLINFFLSRRYPSLSRGFGIKLKI
ncbi:hypothetical protein BKK56_03450 [Rodentibacter genomosp. 2]|nr:hypothetical protein BKK56_03450 [Rodentibacter genomosp. 2]